MKLSAALIIQRLEEFYPVLTNNKFSKDPCLEHFHVYENGIQIKKEQIYLIKGNSSWHSQPKLPNSALLIIIGYQPEMLSDDSTNICFITSNVTCHQVAASIMEIFTLYNSWKETLLESRVQGLTIQYMLDASYPVFKKPMFVVGMDFSVIASVGDVGVYASAPVLGANEETYDIVSTLKQDKVYSDVREMDGYFIYRETCSTSLCVNIKKYGYTTFRLLLLETEKPINECEGFLAEFLASLIEHALLHNTVQRASNVNELHSIFLTLLSDRTADYVTISQKLDSLGWNSKQEYLCLALQTSSLDKKNLTFNAICSYIENMVPESSALQYNDDVVVYINLTNAKMSQSDISKKIIYFIRDSYLKVGYSRIFTGHFNLRRQYVQASVALDVGSRKHPSLWIHTFDDISLPYIFEQITKKLPGYMICHEKLYLLRKIDMEQNTDYLHTLQVYLDNHLNGVQTAKDLFIHRSTFNYRLNRIKELLNTEFDDADEILYLMISFRLLKTEEQKRSSV